VTILKQRTLDYVEFEWGTYVERFHRLPKEEQHQLIKESGYETFRDLLAHILAWWEEGMSIIQLIAEERPFERKRYDFDAFNAEAGAKYKSWEGNEFMAHFEKTRQRMGIDLKSMDEAVFENRRVKGWLHGMVIHHAREHLLTVSRFLTLDMLKNNWATYINDFKGLEPEKQKTFLAEQGFDNFHDLLAHIIGWWEEVARVINGILSSPAFTWQESEIDGFNAESLKKFSTWSEEDLLKHYEGLRLALIDLIERLPEDAFQNKQIASWLASDIVRHYDDHPL
jgi:hypothetical protein